jgi:hypothetical protein
VALELGAPQVPQPPRQPHLGGESLRKLLLKCSTLMKFRLYRQYIGM